MSYGIRVRVWGEYALFTRPEMRTERCSYDIITPSAARGILEAIYWHPGLKWQIDKIYVVSPIQFTSVRRNEVKSKISAGNVLSVMNGGSKPLYISTKEDIMQRSSILLKDVEYVIEAHFDMTENASDEDNHGKFKDIIKRRVKKGQCYHTPYFGCREFPVHFQLSEEDTILTEYRGIEKDLGYMLYDFDYSDMNNIQPLFFRAILHEGILDVRDCEVVR